MFRFEQQQPPIDIAFLAVANAEATLSATPTALEDRDGLIRQAVFHPLDVADALFSSLQAAELVRRALRVLQCCAQFAVHIASTRSSDIERLKSKVEEAQRERSDMFTELVEMREASSIYRDRTQQLKRAYSNVVAEQTQIKAYDEWKKGSRSRNDARRNLNVNSFTCTICGNTYPAEKPLLSHLAKRHPAAQSALRLYQNQHQLEVAEAEKAAALEAQRLECAAVSSMQAEMALVRKAVDDLSLNLRVEQEVQKRAVAIPLPPQQSPVAPVPQIIQLVAPPPQQQQPDSEVLSQLRAQQQRLDVMERFILDSKLIAASTTVASATTNPTRGTDHERYHHAHRAHTAAAATTVPTSIERPKASREKTVADVVHSAPHTPPIDDVSRAIRGASHREQLQQQAHHHSHQGHRPAVSAVMHSIVYDAAISADAGSALAPPAGSSGVEKNIALLSSSNMSGVSPKTPPASTIASPMVLALQGVAGGPSNVKAGASAVKGSTTPEQIPNITAITEEKRDVNEVSFARSSTLNNTTVQVSAPSTIQPLDQSSRLVRNESRTSAVPAAAAVDRSDSLSQSLSVQSGIRAAADISRPQIKAAFGGNEPTVSSRSTPKGSSSSSSSSSSSDSDSDESPGNERPVPRQLAPEVTSQPEKKEKKKPFWQRLFS